MKYETNDEDIKLLKKQIIISTEGAKKILKKFEGDLEKCILDHHDFNENNSKKDEKISTSENDTNKHKISELRDICDKTQKLFDAQRKSNLPTKTI